VAIRAEPPDERQDMISANATQAQTVRPLSDLHNGVIEAMICFWLTRTVCCSALMLFASPLAAQATHPVDGRLILPSVDTFRVSYGGQVIGRGIQITEQVVEEGVPALRQTYTFESSGGDMSTDTLLMDASTLRPIREARASAAGRFKLEFRDKEIATVTLEASSEPATTRTAVDGQVFSSAALEAVVRALPLVDGMQANLDLYYPPPSKRGAVTVSARVIRSEAIVTRNGGSRSAWVVVAGERGEATTFWIDKVNRQLLQIDTEEGSAVIQFRR
jgi:hypothetical protein